ncbi:hypothetical protein J6590_051983 [Homalodisca vitripennis]|nr:hypothetical protein J6590_051983 [Homalodisca vitripennis]
MSRLPYLRMHSTRPPRTYYGLPMCVTLLPTELRTDMSRYMIHPTSIVINPTQLTLLDDAFHTATSPYYGLPMCVTLLPTEYRTDMSRYMIHPTSIVTNPP